MLLSTSHPIILHWMNVIYFKDILLSWNATRCKIMQQIRKVIELIVKNNNPLTVLGVRLLAQDRFNRSPVHYSWRLSSFLCTKISKNIFLWFVLSIKHMNFFISDDKIHHMTCPAHFRNFFLLNNDKGLQCIFFNIKQWIDTLPIDQTDQ